MPSVQEVRRRIEKVPKVKYRRCLQFIYLIDGRVSEAIGRVSPSDKTTAARGPTGRDVEFIVWDEENKIEAVLFTVKSSHGRDGQPRICAIPLNPEYESWAREVALYISKAGPDSYAFPFTRQKVYQVANKTFKGLRYPIKKYDDNEGEEVPAHWKDFKVHALRHLRASDLLSYYGFTQTELCQFGGWGLQNKALELYIYFDWRSYFPKLLKKRYK